jgi:hypothetical protein
VEDVLKMLTRFVEACPDDLWTQSLGGWPTWLHLAHSAWGDDFFAPGESTPIPKGLTSEQIRLMEPPTSTLSKKDFSAYLAKVQARVSESLGALTDADLLKINEKAKKAIGLDWNVAKTLAVMVGHPQYHLGHCDMALRDRGLPGVF